MAKDSATTKKSTRFKWTIRLAVVLLLYTIVGFFVVPAVIKSQMLKRLPALTKRTPEVTQVKFNPYALSLTIRGFALKEADGKVFSSFDEFYVNFQPWASLFKRSWVFDEISLTHPFAQVVYQTNGEFNFANLIDNSAPAPKLKSTNAAALPSVTIYNLNITNGGVAFDDLKRAVPFHTEFSPITVSLTNLTTIRDKNSPYSIMARTDSGETFAWSGKVTVNPLSSTGEFRLGGLQLAKYATYAHDYAKFDIASGLVDVAADYHYDSATNALDLTVSNAAVFLTKFELKAPQTGERLIGIPTLAITNVAASVAARTARVGSVKSSNGFIQLRQNSDGTINLLSMLDLPKSSAEPKTSTPPASAIAPFNAKIDEIAFDNYTIKVEDQKPAKAASFTIDQLGFDVKGVSNQTNATVKTDLSLRFQESGTIAVNGTATLMPPSADLNLSMSNIDLRSIQPYVEQQIKLVINSGAVSVNGRARYASPEPGAPLVSFAGDVAVTKFATSDDVLYKDFAKWDALNIDGIQFQMAPDKIKVEQVKFTGLSTSLIVGPDHRANLQTILRNQIPLTTNSVASTNSTLSASVAAAPEPAAPATPKANLNISLGTLALDNASIHFADQSIEPHCVFDVQEFSGTIKGLSAQPDITAVVDMHGKVDARSPFSVTGKIHPLGDLFADITVAFTNTELTAFTPYTEKFAGRPLSKGKLSFAVHYLIDKKTLKSENGFYIDQFTLGAKNNSPDATKLPVKLAVALLKDRHGRIELNVPVTGRLDDPKFRIGPIIWQVVVNLIAKAATSPFSLLGSMFGGDDELSFVNFTPGQAVIADTETNKLQILTKALFERPELTLEINGSVDPIQDRAPLARAKLDQQIKSMWIAEQTAAGKPAVSLDEVHLEPADSDRLIKADYEKTFGKYTGPSTNQTPASTSQTNTIVVAETTPKKSVTPRGAAALMFNVPKSTSTVAKSAPAASVAAVPAVTPAPAAPEVADMEVQLLQKIEVTDDDWRALMNQRAAKVQTFLLQDGKVTAERLFITAPKPVNPAVAGQDRVNLTLD